MKVARARVMLLLLAMSSAFLPMQIPAEPQSGIEGVITVSPWRPGPVRVDEPGSKPLANATFVVETQANAVASEFTTDAQGRFRVSLPPGHYKVSLKGKKSGVGKYGPFEVDVAAERMTPVQWQCDSGMR
jgi:Carboxypeptidase regulatory-like domain